MIPPVSIKNGTYFVSIDIASQLLGVTTQTLYAWRRQPNPPPFEENRGYDMVKMGEWIRNEQIYKKGKGGSYPWKPDFSKFPGFESKVVAPGLEGIIPVQKESQKDRTDRLRGDKIEMQLKKEAGQLIPANDVEIAISGMASRLKMRMLSIPTKLAPQITGVKDQFEIQEAIEKDIRIALEELSDGELVELTEAG